MIPVQKLEIINILIMLYSLNHKFLDSLDLLLDEHINLLAYPFLLWLD